MPGTDRHSTFLALQPEGWSKRYFQSVIPQEVFNGFPRNTCLPCDHRNLARPVRIQEIADRLIGIITVISALFTLISTTRYHGKFSNRFFAYDRGLNHFQCIRDHSQQLAAMIAATPYSRKVYDSQFSIVSKDPVDKACAFLIKCWHGYGFKTSGI